MKLKLLLTFSLFFSVGVYAQTFYNSGATIGVNSGAVMIVKTDGTTPNSGSLENNAGAAGVFKNKGQVTIEGSFINTSGLADGFAANTGEYIVYKDWVNDATFTADQSTVFLRGTAQQITGSNVTTFYNLNCENAGTVKTQTIDAEVSGILTLQDNELATQDHEMRIINSDPAAISLTGTNPVNNAFVSSTTNGRLVRNTNTSSAYLFPTGWNNNGTPFKREVTIAPSSTNSHTYKVRLGFNSSPPFTSTTDDGYNVATKASNVQSVNDRFYHMIAGSDNTSADLFIHYDATADGSWKSVGRWQNSQWEDLLNTTDVPASPRSQMKRSAWQPTSDQPHALVNPVEVTKDYAFPNVFAPNSTGGYDENTYFTIINQGGKVIMDELSVFNRWGEMVFNNKRDGNDKWNGFYQGKLQQQGNYTFMAKLRSASSGQNLPLVTGNLSLLW